MTTLYQVDHREEPGHGVVHLHRGPVGPTGPAPLQPCKGVSCWFDPRSRGLPTDIWIELDEVDRRDLERLLGPEGPTLLGQTVEVGLAVDERAVPWVGPAARLAALELARTEPPASDQAVWAVEAALLWAALEDLGLGCPEKLEAEVEAMLPALDARRLPSSVDPVLALAIALAHEWADPYSESYRLVPQDETSGKAGDWPELAAALAGLRPAEASTKGVFMGGTDDWSMHDQLWIWLPDAFFPDGDFSGLATLERIPKGLSRRLRITLSRPEDTTVPLFVRLVTSDATGPVVVAVDAMLIDGRQYVSEMDEPSDVIGEELRVEIVEDLNAKLFDDKAFVKRCAQQSARLALRHERLGQKDRARRLWFLAESYHRSADEHPTADEARAAATDEWGEDGPQAPPHLPESDAAGRDSNEDE